VSASKLAITTAVAMALVASTAAASAPCRLSQVELAPGMNSTAVDTLDLEMIGTPDASFPVRVEAADGTDISITVGDAGLSWVRRLSGFPGPGWYRVHVPLPLATYESSGRTLVVGQDDFWADVLVGTSDPGVALVSRCSSTATIKWSEPVVFDADPSTQVELLDDAGVPLACEYWLPQFDGGYAGQPVSGLYGGRCDGGSTVSIRVLRAPRSADGGVVASFPAEGQVWEMTNWAHDDTCAFWQPNLRERSHENVSASGLSPSYAKCPPHPGGCGCGAGASPPVWLALLATLLLFSVRRRAR